jgi:hypothetical protein
MFLVEEPTTKKDLRKSRIRFYELIRIEASNIIISFRRIPYVLKT